MARLQGRAFALLGVNTDTDWGGLLKDHQQKIPWRSWWDGGMWGQVATAWRLPGLPSLFVLDHRGVIRYVNVLGPDLDQAVDTLLGEMERSP